MFVIFFRLLLLRRFHLIASCLWGGNSRAFGNSLLHYLLPKCILFLLHFPLILVFFSFSTGGSLDASQLAFVMATVGFVSLLGVVQGFGTEALVWLGAASNYGNNWKRRLLTTSLL